MSEFYENFNNNNTTSLIFIDDTPLGKVFKYSNDDNYPKKVRIVQVAENEWEVHQTTSEGDLGLPSWLGGNGLLHYRHYWIHGLGFPEKLVFNTYEAALTAVQEYLDQRREFIRKQNNLHSAEKMFKVVNQWEV